MKYILPLAIGLAFCILSAGCGPKIPPYNPFVLSKEDTLWTEIRIIALSPVSVTPWLGNADTTDPIAHRFEELIKAKLEKQGFKVIPSTEYSRINQELTEKVGGYFNPETGERDDEKEEQVYKQTLLELQKKYKTDAILHPSILMVTVYWKGGSAKWDGTSQLLEFWGVSYGKVGALSLETQICKMDGTEIYINRGGIRVPFKMPLGFPNPKIVSIPAEKIFKYNGINANAVNIALDPLRDESKNKKGQK